MNIDNKTCMLAKAPKGTENLSDWIMEPKYDGHRMIAVVNEGRVAMFARSGVDKSGKLPAVEAALSALPNCIVDGEVVAANFTDSAGWGSVQSVLGANDVQSDALVFVVFDVLSVMDADVKQEPYTRRREMLDLLMQHIDAYVEAAVEEQAPVVISPQFSFDAEAIQRMMDEGWEGAIVKNPRATYQSGRRSPDWLKFKAVHTEDVIVTGATEGKGKFSGMIGALVFSQYDENGRLVERGQCSGMTDKERSHFTYLRDNDQLEDVVIEVAHMGVMPTGGLRHPQYKRTRTDKSPEECVIQS